MATARGITSVGWIATRLFPFALAGCVQNTADSTSERLQEGAKSFPAESFDESSSESLVDTAPAIGRARQSLSDGATPMNRRVARIGILNKRNGLTKEWDLKPGESVRIEKVTLHLRACEQTPLWERPPETGAFVQLLVQDYGADDWRMVFSGWLFKERPDRNIVEHPIYDVFVKSCAMTFPDNGAGDDSSGG